MTEKSWAETGNVPHGLYLDILTGIMSGEYLPKSTLPTEGSLANDYGVSRSVVRSALEMLKKRGIVRSQQGSGTVVACCDLQKLNLPDIGNRLSELQDCYACRLAIEPEIAAHLAIQQSESATAYLRVQLTKLEKGPHNSAEEDNLGTASDAEFHVQLAGFSQNSFFSSIMSSMRPHMLFAMNIKKNLTRSAQKNHMIRTQLEHREVILAILNRDAVAAHDVMREHIANGRDRLFLEGLGQTVVGTAKGRVAKKQA
jgi:GntR family transcriptional regulator, transcriptional repressor for pyruvate dehydrogenase complex